MENASLDPVSVNKSVMDCIICSLYNRSCLCLSCQLPNKTVKTCIYRAMFGVDLSHMCIESLQQARLTDSSNCSSLRSADTTTQFVYFSLQRRISLKSNTIKLCLMCLENHPGQDHYIVKYNMCIKSSSMLTKMHVFNDCYHCGVSFDTCRHSFSGSLVQFVARVVKSNFLCD